MKNILVWANGKPLADDTYIEQTEKELGIKFPTSFKEIVLYKDHVRLKKGLFLFEEFTSKTQMEGCLGSILSFNPGLGELGIDWYSQRLNEEIGDGIIPFSKDPGGDLICFDYRKGKGNPNPPVVYWAHEIQENEGISYLADNFDDFMDMLYERGEDE